MIASQIITGLAAAIVAPAIAGITLGIAGQRGFLGQMGRNEAFNHGGNMAVAVLAAVTCWIWGTESVFLLMTTMAVFTVITTLAINKNDIDHKLRAYENTMAWPFLFPFFALLKRLSAVTALPCFFSTWPMRHNADAEHAGCLFPFGLLFTPALMPHHRRYLSAS